MKYIVNLLWDDEVRVWIAEDTNDVGLILEDASYDNLLRRVADALPEIVEINNMPKVDRIMYKLA